MAQATPRHITIPPRRVFGTPGQDFTPDNDSPLDTNGVAARIMAFSRRAPSWSRGHSQEDDRPPTGDKPPIPRAFRVHEQYSTPLPLLPMTVLSITMLGEFLSANVSTPFLLFMVGGFGGFKDEAAVGYWTGILVSVFFLAQFVTSLLWATVAAKHGQRAVLFISLLGSAVTCFAFGAATTLGQAIAIRLLQGVFAGAIGVARGSVMSITDSSNEGRAYAILGFCWGLGGVAGAIIGGTLESPAQRWPETFGHVQFFVNFPYIFPCMVAAFITFLGSILSLFLAYDGGPREGAIQLLPEKTTDRPNASHVNDADEATYGDEIPIYQPSTPITVVGSLGKRLTKKFSGYFSKSHDAPAIFPPARDSETPEHLDVPMSPRTGAAFLRPSLADGSAYGYSGSPAHRQRLASLNARARARSESLTMRRGRRGSHEGSRGVSLGSNNGSELNLNFAQRLLMANENAVTNIADFWVAAAMNVDTEEVFWDGDDDANEPGEEMVDGDDLHSRVIDADNLDSDTDSANDDDEMEFQAALNTSPSRRPRLSASGSRTSFSHNQPLLSPRRPPLMIYRTLSSSGWSSSAAGGSGRGDTRRPSAVPSIFSHTGVRTPLSIVDDAISGAPVPMPPVFNRGDLRPIVEGQPLSFSSRGSSDREVDAEAQDVDALIESSKPPGLLSQLPLAVIIQYGLLALHGTTHDQVFVLYLLSPYVSGGLNLKSGNFSQLIAVMCLAQIGYQFYLYPNIGPPRGRFSHLAMFRIGSLLFIPAYLSVILYRAFAHEDQDGNFIVMAALVLSTAIRYCGSTFAYTSVSILLNYLSPPPVVGLANGLAQSIVSLARFAGPILGGYLWSISVQDNPSGYPLGFLVCSGVCALAVMGSFFIR